MNITIRKAEAKDFEEVIHLFKEFAEFQKMPEKMTNTVGLMNQEKDYFNCFVALDNANNKIIGYASCFFAYYTWTGKSLYLDDIYVQPAFRKLGTGQKLMEKIIAYAKTENCKKVRWQVSRWNKNAIGFYKKLGADIDNVELNCDYKIQ